MYTSWYILLVYEIVYMEYNYDHNYNYSSASNIYWQEVHEVHFPDNYTVVFIYHT